MSKFWPDGWDYNESVKNYPDWWKDQSRTNEYTIIDNRGEVRNILYPLKQYKIRSILDYGCGHSNSIQNSLEKYGRLDKIQVTGYDPFIEGKNIRPAGKFDMVVCHNVMGSTNFKYTYAIIEDLLQYSKKIVSIKIPSSKKMLKPYITAVNEAKGKVIIDLFVYPSKESYPSEDLKKVPEFYIYFLLRKAKLE
jgi:hypothetical protein